MGTVFEAEINPATKEVQRVVVSPTPGWAATTLGGEWELSAGDVTADEVPGRVMAGIGSHLDLGVPEAFVSDVWDNTKATVPDEEGEYFYNTEGMLTWHLDKAWRNLSPTGTPNVWAPGVANWREYPLDPSGVPIWVQPVGSVDAYPIDFEVMHEDVKYRSVVEANVWAPGTDENLWETVT